MPARAVRISDECTITGTRLRSGLTIGSARRGQRPGCAPWRGGSRRRTEADTPFSSASGASDVGSWREGCEGRPASHALARRPRLK